MMRTLLALFALLLSGIALAQDNSYEQQVLQCAESCCTSDMGHWNSNQHYCEQGDAAFSTNPEYDDCVASCMGSVGNIGGTNPIIEEGANRICCCLPVFALLGILGLAAIRKG
jgi:hypothetical protein